MNAYDVTLVVPVYNVEQYLQECLESIAAQTAFERCEVLLVDNGSTDGSYRICAEFARRHVNATVLVRRGGGAGAARNLGMDRATGGRITFCDSDDVLPPTALERMLDAAERTGAQVVVGMMETFPRPTNWAWRGYFGQGDRTFASVAEMPELVHSASACNKLFDIAYLRSHGIRFAEGVHFEDAYVGVAALVLATRLALVDQCVYQYRKRAAGNSTMDAIWTRRQNYWDHLQLVEYLHRMRAALPDLSRAVLDLFLVRSYQGFALRAPELFQGAELEDIYSRCRAVYRDVEPDLVVRGTADTRHRVAYLAFLTGDFGLFADRAARVHKVSVRDGIPYLFGDLPGRLSPLARATPFTARLEHVRKVPGTGTLRLAGRFEVGGMPMFRPLEGHLSLRVRGSRLSVPATQVRRRDMKNTRPDTEWGGFTADLPLDALRRGVHDLEFVVDAEGGQAITPCLVAAGYLRGARVVGHGGIRVVPHWKGKNRAVLMVLGPARRPGRRTVLGGLVAKDAKHVLRRRPFWKQRLIRLLTRPLAPLLLGRDLWLIGERGDTAQDNGWHLFRHLRTVGKRRGVYYVIRSTSPDRTRLAGLGHVVAHSSWKHKLLMLHASALVNAYDIDTYMLPDGWDRTRYLKHLDWRVGARRVFLQHGVTDKDVSKGLHRNRTGVDLILAVSRDEGRFLAEELGYEGQVAVAGFPRFDALTPARGGRTILFMPTWRAYLTVASYSRDGRDREARRAARDRFLASSYQEFMVRFLNDPDLAAALDRYDYTLEFLPHYEMRAMVGEMVPDRERIRVIDQNEVSVQEAMRRCDLFITDWSSTAFDVAYLGTPLVYAQFDADEYWDGHYQKGYFDARRDGFGPVRESVEEVVAEVVRYLRGGCAREPEYQRRAERFFEYRDRQNNVRASEAIDRLVRGSNH
ncbi:glycosyltransferase involved in cell wall biosynthesis [Streptomyces sp. BK208]|uniref:bifunctional glycosyltransferase/CDP-glycerol:glycerophosphate glycerophosphotransferase n=1 Tax=Streptomyces sp. BK208 TaxID=2512150 RepID=UPI0010605C76|nr:glycosyltransferase [Streptomyces sp. BK208]TDT39929.1 glycosyltransferase involved in cell wall biosynthesis [Streptomyces sp. BK208]